MSKLKKIVNQNPFVGRSPSAPNLLLGCVVLVIILTACSRINAQTFSYWDPNLDSPFDCSEQYSYWGHVTSANGVLYAIRNNLAGTESLFQWTEGGNWKDIGDLNGIGAGGTGGNPGAICLHGNYVYVGGQFTEVSCNGVTVLTGASNIAAFDMVHGTWSVVGNGALTGEEVCAIVFDNLGNLYVGQPSFDGDQTKLVQKWNGAGWSSITGFLNLPLNCVNALAFDGTSLYVGATAPGTSYEGPDFTSLATVLQLNLTTSSWKQMGNPALEGGPLEAGAVVYSLAVQGTDLFAAGIFGPSAESSSSFANIPAVSCYRYNTVSGLRLPFVRLQRGTIRISCRRRGVTVLERLALSCGAV